MSAMGEATIILTGPPGMGKTTAIRFMSELPVITAKAAANRDEMTAATNADAGAVCGELQVDESLVLRLYGADGPCWRNHWDWLAQSALGFVIFIDNASATPLADLSLYLDCFQDHIQEAAVIVVTHTEASPQPTAAAYYALLQDRHVFYPVVAADVSQPKDVIGVLDLLLLSLEQA